ncbi:MAG: tRNA (adenosine(37)-N6)-threonylcarbamoyltransferase complex dimerization subunit type 1 TsaB [Tannerella sp.]|nr:tRNA (adenosine(37)-N6)-threonylcarbamoyltransferase complex dimerization subunit type 1 TsaB [Tannerella sp.]
MACILHLETATPVCSVALSVNGTVVFEQISYEGASHAALLGVFTEEAVSFAETESYHLDAVAVSRGPGSYTGLRIGTSMAKGLCMGWEIPLIAIPTLDLMASKAIRRCADKEGLYCAMLDARRMEVYAAIYDAGLSAVRETKAEVVTPETYRAFLEQGRVYFFGNGAAKCRAVIASETAVFPENIHPLATDMAALAENAFQKAAFEDVAYFEPFYLKEFMATTPKNKVLYSTQQGLTK